MDGSRTKKSGRAARWRRKSRGSLLVYQESGWRSVVIASLKCELRRVEAAIEVLETLAGQPKTENRWTPGQGGKANCEDGYVH